MDNVKVNGVVDCLEGRDSIRRVLDRLGKWAGVKLLKVHRANRKVLYLDQSQ